MTNDSRHWSLSLVFAAMRDVLRQLIAAIRAGRPVAWCRLVETRGSTPQKAGAAMLVYDDGSQAGTLGGGCVEAEVKRRALGLLGRESLRGLHVSARQRLRLGRRADLRRADEDARRAGRARHADRVFRAAGRTDRARCRAARRRSSSTPRPADCPRRRAICSMPRASSSPACEQRPSIPPQITDQLRPLSSRPQAYAAHGIAFLPVLPRCRLVIVGGGHVGKAVADLAAELEFDVWVVDDRPEFVAGVAVSAGRAADQRADRPPAAERRNHAAIRTA